MPERGAELTAQQLYPKMIKELIGPALQAQVREALRAAAAEDEDLQVRWAARYAIRLATQHDDDSS